MSLPPYLAATGCGHNILRPPLKDKTRGGSRPPLMESNAVAWEAGHGRTDIQLLNHKMWWPEGRNGATCSGVPLSGPWRAGERGYFAVPALRPLGGGRGCCCPCPPANPRLDQTGPCGPAWPRRGLRRVRGPRLRPIGFARAPPFPWRWSNKERSGPGKAFRAVGGGPGQWPRLRVRGAGAAFALLGLYGPPSLRRGRCPALLGPLCGRGRALLLPGHSIPREAGGCPLALPRPDTGGFCSTEVFRQSHLQYRDAFFVRFSGGDT